jgi:hypothetical protein
MNLKWNLNLCEIAKNFFGRIWAATKRVVARIGGDLAEFGGVAIGMA